jgi:hypothetical protein
VRGNGPQHLRDMSVSEVERLLIDFVIENYWYLANETLFSQHPGPFSSFVSEDTAIRLAEALHQSAIFTPIDVLFLYPLVTVQIDADFNGQNAFLIPAASLTLSRLAIDQRTRLLSDRFPPINEGYKSEIVETWLGIKGPFPKIADKRKSVILGALALTIPNHQRKMFSGRHVVEGRCSVSPEGVSVSFAEKNTPPLMHNVIVQTQDHAWLSKSDTLITSDDETSRRYCRALEYFYRAWPLEANESFPLHFMAMDSIFGDSSQATKAIIDALGVHGNDLLPPDRLRLLLRLRATVIHGGAPNVHESDKYQRYFDLYGDDPVQDMEALTAKCLRNVVFGTGL